MITFHRRLFITLTTIFVVSFILLGFFLSTGLSERINSSEEKRLNKEADQFLNLVEKDSDALEHIQIINAYSDDQIMIKKDDKMIFISNDVKQKELEEKMQPWIEESKNGEFYHYFPESKEALLIHNRGDYQIYMLEPLDDISEMNKRIWKFLSLLFLVELPVLYFIVRYINKSYVEPINEVTYASKLLAEGNYKVRVPESSVSETKDLYISTNILARTLQALNNEQKLQRNRLETILQNIPSAIMLVNNHGEVVVANKTYQNMVKNGASISSGYYEDVIDSPEINKMIRHALVTEKASNATIGVKISVHQKYYDVAVVPVLSATRKKLEGVVIVMHDITQLKTLEQMRKDFVANVSHELKTPITSIKGFSETLMDGAKDDPATLDMFLDIILKESNRIQILVSELLELSKIEQNSELQLTKVDASQKVLNCIDVLVHQAQLKGIEIIADVEEDVYVAAEPSKLKQVIINLLSNAINYSPQDAVVKVRLYSKGDQCILEVEDQGIGIAPHEQARIFERFYRVDKARSRDSGGTGLGLAIVKHIIEVFNGEIDVESDLGKGSIFKVTLNKI